MIKSNELTEAQLEFLSAAKRNQTLLKCIVESVSKKELKAINEKVEILTLRLEDGTKVYCTADEFDDYKHKTLTAFAGSAHYVVITSIDLDDHHVIGSIKLANKISSEQFLEDLRENFDNMQNMKFKAEVVGIDNVHGNIYLRINGLTVHMKKTQYDWNVSPSADISLYVSRGDSFYVSPTAFDAKNNILRVSRKKLLPNPFEELAKKEKNESIVAIISDVHPVHGIFARLPDNNIEVKAVKNNWLPDPVPGDVVSARVRSVDVKNCKARISIIGYPQGKKKKDVFSNLFG